MGERTWDVSDSLVKPDRSAPDGAHDVYPSARLRQAQPAEGSSCR